MVTSTSVGETRDATLSILIKKCYNSAHGYTNKKAKNNA